MLFKFRDGVLIASKQPLSSLRTFGRFVIIIIIITTFAVDFTLANYLYVK